MIKYKGLVFDVGHRHPDDAGKELRVYFNQGFALDSVVKGRHPWGESIYKAYVSFDGKRYSLTDVANTLKSPLIFGDRNQIMALELACFFMTQMDFDSVTELGHLDELGVCDGKI